MPFFFVSYSVCVVSCESRAEAKYEKGVRSGGLTGTDTTSWENKSWVVGIQVGDQYKAYDWNDLKRRRIINDEINGKAIFVVLGKDDQSFVAYCLANNSHELLYRAESSTARRAAFAPSHRI